MSHRQLIKSLIAEIRQLRIKLNDAYYEMDEVSSAAYRAQERALQARRDAEYATQEASRVREQAEYNEYQRQDAMKDLERARQWGNDWEEQRALDKLKRIY